MIYACMYRWRSGGGGGVVLLGMGSTLGCGCAAGTLEPLTYTRATMVSARFCYPILE